MYSPITIPRYRLFTLEDGRFVVQWEENRIQDLLSGKYQLYDAASYSPDPITDYELNQLRQAGVISSFTADVVHVYPHSRYNEHSSTRIYYLNTAQPRTELSRMVMVLEQAGLQDVFSLRVQGIFVIVRSQEGRPFNSFEVAEKARERLAEAAGPMFQKCVVAFQEHFQPDSK